MVIESEFAITKLPTKRATPPKPSRNFCRNEMNEFVSYVRSELIRANQEGWQERFEQALVKLPPTQIVRAPDEKA